MERKIEISKQEVMLRVAETTAYTGAKMDDDKEGKAWERISTVDEDEAHLERFWEEGRSEVCNELRGLVLSELMRGEAYELRLELSSRFDDALLDGMRTSLESYFVNSITGKWYMYTNKAEASAYLTKAGACLEDLHRKAVFKHRPLRPKY